MTPLNHRIGEAGQIALMPVAAFNLGRLSKHFSGSLAAWTALVCFIFALALLLFKFTRRALKPNL